MDWLDQILLFLASLAANFFSAFAGGGAGLIQFPVLIFLGLSFAVALATHKVASVALGLGATLRHLREGQLQWRFALFLLATGLPGVMIGAYFILQVPDQLAKTVLGLLTIGLGLYSFSKTGLGLENKPLNRDRRGYIIGGLVLFLIGIGNGSITSGTGLFCTLWLVRWFGFDYQQAVAYTLVLVGLFWNATGAVTLTMLGEVYWVWLPVLLAGSLLGGYLGAHAAITRGSRWIKKIFEVITIVIGIKLLF
ncbi:MAG: sulfite exporter TauE/SafE family protein [Acidiferrobacterales bacterium]